MLGVMGLAIPGQTTRACGVVTTSELLASGLTKRQIRTLTGRGDLVAIRHGAYAQGDRARKLLSLAGGEQLLKIAAAVAVTGPAAVVSHSSAASLHEIDLLREAKAEVHLTCPRERDRRAGAGIHVHTAQLPGAHVTEVARLAVTTAARTVVDLARTAEFRAGVVAADSALHQRLTTRRELQAVLASCRGWRGTTRAAEVVEFADGLAESPLESLARVVFRDGGLPAPRLQARFGDFVDVVARVDFYWPKYRTIVEVDGALKYADPQRARQQLERDSWLRAQGFEVVHLTWEQVTGSPQAVVAAVRRAFQRGTLLASAGRQAGTARSAG